MTLLRRARAWPGALIRALARPAPRGNDVEADLDRSFVRRGALRALVGAAILVPAAVMLAKQGLTGRAVFAFPMAAAFAALIDRTAIAGMPPAAVPPRRVTALLPVIVVLGAALDLVSQGNWMIAIALGSAAVGRHSPTRRISVAAILGCAAISTGIGYWEHVGGGALFGDALLPLLAGSLSYLSHRRNLLIRRLNETRAELARMAVAAERLRIARDLHDLLGHSLSLIAIKAELAGRLLDADHARAAREIAELETVARQSLNEVREAVTAYRQPSLAAELAAARRLLASAGVECRIRQPEDLSLPPAADALLAWTVREGATNIVRHSGARQAQFTIEVADGRVSAELADDGAGHAGRPGRSAGSDGAGGSGLAGLSERAARLDGVLEAGGQPAGGFRLWVSVPLAPAGAQSPAEATA